MRWVKRILAVLGVLVVLLVALAFFLLGTAPGGRLTLDAIVLPLLPAEVEMADFSGRLWGNFELIGAEFRVPGVEAKAERVAVRFRPWALLGRHVELHRLELTGVDVRVFEPPATDSVSERPDSAVAAADTAPPLSDLPVRITFDSVLVRDLAVTVQDSITLTGGRLRLAGSLDRFSVVFEGMANDPTVGDVDVTLEGEGSTDRLRVARLLIRALEGTISGSGEFGWWPHLAWQFEFTGEDLQPAGLMEDPAEWPGALFIAARMTGSVQPASGLELEAMVDTVYGTLRGEPLSGRLSGTLAGGVLDLDALALGWGPARVRASGSYAEAADLDFEASVPDLGLALPGSAGSVEARGRLSGTAEGPRIVADFEARDIAVEGGQYTAAYAGGSVDLDLSARGGLSGNVVVHSLMLADEALDSVTATLSGSRAAHVVTVDAVGPGASLRFEAAGGLIGNDTWHGTVASLEVAEDSILGVWTLADSVEVTLSADSVRLGQACLLSDSARLCVAGTHDASGTHFIAETSGLDLVRAKPFLPETLEIDAVLEAEVDLTLPASGPITGRIEARTTAGELILTQDIGQESADGVAREDRVRRLAFAPASFVVKASTDSLTGSVDVAASDSAGTLVIALTGELNAPALEKLDALFDRSASTRFELRVTDLSLLPFLDFERWDIDGALVATAAFDVDEERNVSGTMEIDAGPIVLSREISTGQRRLTIEPARFDLIVDEAGLRAEVDITVSTDERSGILLAKGNATLPGLNRIDADLALQPVDGHIEVTTADLAVAEGVGDLITEAEGSFDLNADLGGTLGDLSMVGEARLKDGRLVLPDIGLELTGIQLTATGAPDGSVSVSGEVTSGEGRVEIEGRSASGPSEETPTRIAIRGERFEIMNRPEIQLRADPDLELVFDGSAVTVTGQLHIPRGRLEFSEIPEGAVTRSSDVIIVTDSVVTPKPKVPVGLDVQLTLGDDIFFKGFGLTARLGGDLRILQDPGRDLRGRGEITLIDGTFNQFGQDLRVEPGRIVFSGPLDRPQVDVRAFVRAKDGTEAGLLIGGTPQQLTMETYSRPQKSESETMSYILFGRSLNDASGGEGNEANNAAAILGANVIAMSLAPSVGLDEARIETGSSQDRAQFVMGKYLTPKLYVGYGVGIYQPISTFRIRYLLSTKWSIESMTGDERATDLLYRFEIGGVKKKSESDDAEAERSSSEGGG